MTSNFVVVAVALVLEGVLSEPANRAHPVAWLGRFASFVESKLRRPGAGPGTQRVSGILAWFMVTVPTVAVAALSVRAAWNLLPAGYGLSVILVWLSISPKALGRSASNIAGSLRRSDIVEARSLLGAIVGRRTGDLPPGEVASAVIESVAENSADAMVAPILYALLLGPIGAVMYRVVNTLDSMWGYRDARYRFFGTAAARADDVLSFVPSRCAALMLGAAAWLRLGRGRASLAALARFGHQHPSPNSGRPEAAMAGALGVSLGGPVCYEGTVSERGVMCEGQRSPLPADIDNAVRLLFDSWLMLLLVAACGGIAVGFL